jgi:hypothetical protein
VLNQAQAVSVHLINAASPLGLTLPGSQPALRTPAERQRVPFERARAAHKQSLVPLSAGDQFHVRSQLQPLSARQPLVSKF